MNFDEMSDCNINKKLSGLLGVNVLAVAQDGLIVDDRSASVDYCNSWADMGPLIAKYKISLIEFGGSWEAEIETSAPIGKFDTDEICSITVVNKNPLRAAAICLIKKLEAENE